MFERVAVGIIFLSLALFLPFYVYALLSFVCVIRYKNFWEGIMSGLIIDLLYGVPVSKFFGFEFVVTLGQTLLFVARKIVSGKLFKNEINVK